jgi:hypothetical protein
MLLLGLLVVAAAVVFSTLVIADNLGGGPHYSVSLFDHHLGTVNTLGAFLAGIALTLVFCLGLLMMTSGARRGYRRNTELRAVRRERRAAEKTQAGATAATATSPGFDAFSAGGSADEDTAPTKELPKRRSRASQIFSH